MAILDEAEDDVIKIVGILLLLLIVGIIFVAWAAWKKVSVPATLYPDNVWGTLSTGVDRAFIGAGLDKTDIKSKADSWLGGIYGWIVENLPVTPSSKLPAGNADEPTTVQAGSPDGTEVADYSAQDSGGTGL